MSTKMKKMLLVSSVLAIALSLPAFANSFREEARRVMRSPYWVPVSHRYSNIFWNSKERYTSRTTNVTRFWVQANGIYIKVGHSCLYPSIFYIFYSTNKDFSQENKEFRSCNSRSCTSFSHWEREVVENASYSMCGKHREPIRLEDRP